MKTVRPNEIETAELQIAATLLASANMLLASAKKNADAAKEKLAKWLLEHREIDLETLAIGELVQIDGVCLIERAKQHKFDQKKFQMDCPTQYLEFERDFPITKFKPLV